MSVDALLVELPVKVVCRRSQVRVLPTGFPARGHTKRETETARRAGRDRISAARFAACVGAPVVLPEPPPGSSPGRGLGGFTSYEVRVTNLWVLRFINANQAN